MKAREEKEKATGRKPPGKPPAPPAAGPGATDQINLTDEDSRIMPVAGGGFEQAYNAQAAVAAGSLLVVAADVVQAANDKQQVEPMLDRLGQLPEALGKPETLLADSGYFSEANVDACAAAKIEPLIAMGATAIIRPGTSASPQRRPPRRHPTPLEAMAHRLTTPEGKKALRPAQADARTGVRHHQIGDRLPAIPAARPRQRSKASGAWSPWPATSSGCSPWPPPEQTSANRIVKRRSANHEIFTALGALATLPRLLAFTDCRVARFPGRLAGGGLCRLAATTAKKGCAMHETSQRADPFNNPAYGRMGLVKQYLGRWGRGMVRMRMVACVGLGLLAGCTTSADMPKASLEQQREALAFRARTGMSRVYVLNGLQHTLMFDRDYHTPADYFINERQICSLNAGEYFVIDLPPGDYSIMWRQRTSDPLASKGSPTPLSVRPDEVIFLRSVEDVRVLQRSALIGGAIGIFGVLIV